MTEGKTPKRSRAPRVHTLELPARLDIAAVGGLKHLLDAALASAQPPTLDASRVEHVDAAGLQLLLAFQHANSAGGASATWRDPSPALIEAAALLGITEALHLATHSES